MAPADITTHETTAWKESFEQHYRSRLLRQHLCKCKRGRLETKISVLCLTMGGIRCGMKGGNC